MKYTEFRKQELYANKLKSEQLKMTVKCKCGCRVHFYAFEERTKAICKNCKKYVFKTKRDEFKFRLMELINRYRILEEEFNAYKTI